MKIDLSFPDLIDEENEVMPKKKSVHHHKKKAPKILSKSVMIDQSMMASTPGTDRYVQTDKEGFN